MPDHLPPSARTQPDHHRAAATIRVLVPYKLNTLAEKLYLTDPQVGFHRALLAAAEAVARGYAARPRSSDDGRTDDGHLILRGFHGGSTRLFDEYAPGPLPESLDLVWGEQGVFAHHRFHLVRLNVDQEGRSTAFTRAPD